MPCQTKINHSFPSTQKYLEEEKSRSTIISTTLKCFKNVMKGSLFEALQDAIKKLHLDFFVTLDYGLEKMGK